MLSYRCIRACPIGFHSISTIIFTDIIHFSQFFCCCGEFVADFIGNNTIYMHCRGICISISQLLLVHVGQRMERIGNLLIREELSFEQFADRPIISKKILICQKW